MAFVFFLNIASYLLKTFFNINIYLKIVISIFKTAKKQQPNNAIINLNTKHVHYAQFNIKFK